MTGELLSLELIELKIFEHFIRLQNLKEINIHDVHDQIQGHLLAHARTRDISFYMLYDISYMPYHINIPILYANYCKYCSTLNPEEILNQVEIGTYLVYQK